MHRRFAKLPRHAMQALLLLAFAVTMTACGDAERQANDDASDPTVAYGTLHADDASARPAMDADRDAASPTAPAPLPETRPLQVVVEGQAEQRNARLFESPQGYAIYVLPQIEMTQEEPCCDLAHAKFDGNYFMRIERIATDTPLDRLREDAMLALSSVGTAADAPAPHDGMAVPATELHLAAQGHDTTMDILVIRVGEGRYRVTLHLPLGEAVEGIAPTLWAMLGSLQTTGPLQRP